ncbi:MAG: hypothetical protein WEB13_06035, partial [Dehalococcoidia bacterium]
MVLRVIALLGAPGSAEATRLSAPLPTVMELATTTTGGTGGYTAVGVIALVEDQPGDFAPSRGHGLRAGVDRVECVNDEIARSAGP